MNNNGNHAMLKTISVVAAVTLAVTMITVTTAEWVYAEDTSNTQSGITLNNDVSVAQECTNVRGCIANPSLCVDMNQQGSGEPRVNSRGQCSPQTGGVAADN